MSKPRSGPILIRRKCQYQGGDMYASLKDIQAVWAVVTEHPAMSVRRIKCRLGMGKDRVWHILNFLQNAGYIRPIHGCQGREIVIPFVCVVGGTAPPKQPLTEAEAEQPI